METATVEFKPKDLKHYLDIAYELLYKANQYPPIALKAMQQELVNFKNYRAGKGFGVPSGIDAAIAATLLDIQL